MFTAPFHSYILFKLTNTLTLITSVPVLLDGTRLNIKRMFQYVSICYPMAGFFICWLTHLSTNQQIFCYPAGRQPGAIILVQNKPQYYIVYMPKCRRMKYDEPVDVSQIQNHYSKIVFISNICKSAARGRSRRLVT